MSEKNMIGFIGAGNMATALIKGLIQSGAWKNTRLAASDKDPARLAAICSQFRIRSYPSNPEMVAECSIIVLSVKPQNMQDVLAEIRDFVSEDHLIISIAAGIPLSLMQRFVGIQVPMIRVMPNTPALVQKGVSALAGNELAGPKHMETARKIFGAVGVTVDVVETMMDAVTALSGSGPGYVFRIMEAMVNAGVSVGLEKEISTRLVIQTFRGAADLAGESEQSLSALREMVTSPGGTTAQGLGVMNEKGLEEIIIKAIDAACKRSVELGKNTG